MAINASVPPASGIKAANPPTIAEIIDIMKMSIIWALNRAQNPTYSGSAMASASGVIGAPQLLQNLASTANDFAQKGHALRIGEPHRTQNWERIAFWCPQELHWVNPSDPGIIGSASATLQNAAYN